MNAQRKPRGRPPLKTHTADNAVSRFLAARPGLSQKRLGELTGYSEPSVSNMETGRLPVSKRMLAALALLESTIAAGAGG